MASRSLDTTSLSYLIMHMYYIMAAEVAEPRNASPEINYSLQVLSSDLVVESTQ